MSSSSESGLVSRNKQTPNKDYKNIKKQFLREFLYTFLIGWYLWSGIASK